MELVTGLKTVLPGAAVFLIIFFLVPMGEEVTETVKALISFGAAAITIFGSIKVFGKKPKNSNDSASSNA